MNSTSAQAPSDPAGRTARDKVRTLDQLSQIADEAKAQGRTVVLCHGVFDLLHMGHVRHLEAAKREGDLLVVTVTADKFVNKGPGRPIFPETIRAEMLAALEYVDWVGINPNPSAETVLDAVRPNVYVKGSDYENPEEDITGKIKDEKAAVEMHGGRVVFTKDITFSSSSLINRYLDVYDVPVRDFLDGVREADGLATISRVMDKAAGFKVLIVGDTIIDEYNFVSPLGKPSKEHMIASKFENREVFAGGVVAAANHLASICAQVDILTSVGDSDDTDYEAFVRDHVKANVNPIIYKVPGRPTTRKSRFVDQGYMRKLFEVYHIDDSPLPADIEAKITSQIASIASGYDLVVVTDFGHGLIGNDTVKALVNNARFLAVNAQTNAGNQGFNLITKYPKADFICIDAPEARLATRDKFGDIAMVVSEQLPAAIACDRIIVTHGRHGCCAWKAGEPVLRVPAFTHTVVDTVGAGDAFFAVTAPLAAAGGEMAHLGLVGNGAGAIKVGILGHRQSVERTSLLKFVTTLLK